MGQRHRVLVTGSDGFIGRYVVASLERRGCEVVELPHRWNSTSELQTLLETAEPDRCIHLGWYAKPADYLTNVAGNLASLSAVLELADALGERSCKHLLAAGTCAEYAPSSSPLPEHAPVHPWSVYGAAKAASWLLLDSSLTAGRLAVGWARIFNVTGPGEAPTRPVAAVARAALQRHDLDMSDGTQVRDFLDVRDVADALAHLSSVEAEAPVNVCSGRPVTLRHLFTTVATEAGGSDVLRWGRRERPPTDIDFVVGEPTRLSELGWAPTYSFDDMVTGVVDYWRTQMRAAPGASTEQRE